LQNCCARLSIVETWFAQFTDTQSTITVGYRELAQKQFTSTTLEQFDIAAPSAKQPDTQDETLLKVGNCALTVAVALILELEVTEIAVDVLPIIDADDDAEESVELVVV